MIEGDDKKKQIPYSFSHRHECICFHSHEEPQVRQSQSPPWAVLLLQFWVQYYPEKQVLLLW